MTYKEILDNTAGHFKTITEHKIRVMRHCFDIGLYGQGLLHDLSKYAPVEFLNGCKYYQHGKRSPNNAEREDKGYSMAWMHHKGRNRHHYEYWTDYRVRKEEAPADPAAGESAAGDREAAARRERLERQMALLRSREIPDSAREIDAAIGMVREENGYGPAANKGNPGFVGAPDPAGKTGLDAGTVPNTDNGTQMSFSDIPVLSEQARPRHRIVGQVFRTYWLIEYEDQLLFVDQHAAHEKVMYEKFLGDLKNREIHQQMVAPPVVLTFSIREKECYLRCRESFRQMGFLIEEFGGNEYCIRAVPANLLDIDPQELFVDLLDQIEENGAGISMDKLTERLASMACKAAVKGNMTMTTAEMDSLMDQLLLLDNPYQCPHGRPTIISMSKREVEKKFKRI